MFTLIGRAESLPSHEPTLYNLYHKISQITSMHLHCFDVSLSSFHHLQLAEIALGGWKERTILSTTGLILLLQ